MQTPTIGRIVIVSRRLGEPETWPAIVTAVHETEIDCVVFGTNGLSTSGTWPRVRVKYSEVPSETHDFTWRWPERV